jgi:DNA primase
MPYISQSFIDNLANQIDIVDLIGKRLSLKKTGGDYRAPCPFHGGKNRNFSVSTSKQFYHCFKCGESGGAISFVQKIDNLSFVEAIESIASDFGLTIEYEQANTPPKDVRFERYQELLAKVSEFYIAQLKGSPARDKAVNYAKSRGLNGQIAKRFSLGFATPSNQDLQLHFEQDTQALEDLKVLGLVKTGEYGDYDFFRDRLMFPIHNTKGKVIAFGGRAFDKKTKAKYLNSSESLVFSKTKELYGLYHARQYSRSLDYILVVEGYMDVVALHQAGLTRVVATLGTATSEQHIQTLMRSTAQIVFCFDGDEAGKSAAWKALKIALSLVKSGIVFKFLFLPEGEDPDSLINKEALPAFIQRVEQAQPLSQFLFKQLKSEVEFTTIEGKALFLDKALFLIKQIQYPAYLQQLLEGLALEVGQNIEKIQTLFLALEPKSKPAPVESNSSEVVFENFAQDYELDMPIYSEPVDISPEPEYPHNAPLITHMIGILLNNPSLMDEATELRVRKIEQAVLLHELANSALLDDEIDLEGLIEPFADKRAYLQDLYAKKNI